MVGHEPRSSLQAAQASSSTGNLGQNASGGAGPMGAPRREEWMLAPPPSASVAQMLQADPRSALKARGFSQSGTQRVQRHGGGGQEVDSALWTESPAERQQRLLDEEMGVRGKATLDDVNETGRRSSSLQQQQHLDAERQREDRIRAAVQEHTAARGPSLLEQHQAKRRSSLREKSKRNGSDESEDDRERRHRHKEKHRSREDKHRRRNRSASPSDSESRTHREHRREEEHTSKRSSKSSRTHNHHRRYKDEDEKERNRRERHERHREERDRKHEKERKKRKREEEERSEKKGAPMMVWDRDAAMSVGGRLMDERKRLDVIKGASSLNDRFGQGTSRYM